MVWGHYPAGFAAAGGMGAFTRRGDSPRGGDAPRRLNEGA